MNISLEAKKNGTGWNINKVIIGGMLTSMFSIVYDKRAMAQKLRYNRPIMIILFDFS